MIMKKRLWFLAFALIFMLCFTACGKEEEPQPSTDVPEEEIQDTDEEDETEDVDSEDGSDEVLAEDSQDSDPSGSDLAEPDAGPASITVFYSNADATGLDSEEVQIAALSPEEVLKALVGKGALSADIQVLSLETKTVDGKESVEMDLNEAFVPYLSSVGSTGEYYVMGSVCNTFLKAYDCEQIKITVNGQDLATGHAEYPGYMTEFPGE